MKKISNIKKIIPIFLLSIIIFTIPVSARWAYVNPVETITRSNANTTKARCLHYARRIMGHNALKLKKEVKVTGSTTTQKYTKWITVIFNEIAEGRPILLVAKKRNSNQSYHWVLAYQFGIYSGKKEYQTLTIIDSITNEICSANNYQFQYRYQKVDGEHYWEQDKKRDEIVNFAYKFTKNGGYRSIDIYNHVVRVYGKKSLWATNSTFGNGADWCCYFVNFVYNKSGMMPYAVQYNKYTNYSPYSPLATTEGLMGQARYNGKFKYKKNYTPQKGDIIFFDWSYDGRDGYADHVGIVESVSGNRVYTIEGNTGNNNANYSKVYRWNYPLNSADILGYLNPYA